MTAGRYVACLYATMRVTREREKERKKEGIKYPSIKKTFSQIDDYIRKLNKHTNINKIDVILCS